MLADSSGARTATHFRLAKQAADEPLAECVRRALETYFDQLDGYAPNELHRLLLEEVERPLLEVVMRRTGGNQTRAAQLLGLSRSTLRKKLAHFGLL
jgi:Fis family transcriptional regulator